MTPCREQVNVGAYVLDVLEPNDRDRMQQHLGTCAACTADRDDLAALPGHLAAVDPTDLVDPPTFVPGELAFRRLEAAATRQPRRPSRRRGIAVAAAVVLGVAVSGGALSVRSHDQPQQPQVVTAVAGGVHGRAVLTATQNGTQVRLTLGGVRSNARCRLVAVGRDGSRQTASTWTATYDGDASVTASLKGQPRDIDRLVIETLDGQTLLILSPPPA